MKDKENNLEKNISRLVKLAGDSDKPGEKFTDSVIYNALRELKQPVNNSRREGRNKTMKVMKIFSCAAAVIVAAGVIFGIVISNLNSRRLMRDESAQAPSLKTTEDKIEVDMVVAKDDSGLKHSELRAKQEQRDILEKAEPEESVSAWTPIETKKPSSHQEVALGIEYTKGQAPSDAAEKPSTIDTFKAVKPQAPVSDDTMVALEQAQTMESLKAGASKSSALVDKKEVRRMSQAELEEALKKQDALREQQVARERLGDVTTYNYQNLPSGRGMMGGGMGGGMEGGMSGGEYGQTERYYPSRAAGRSFVLSSSIPEEPASHRPPMAHGGSVPVNGEAYDAMFFQNYGVNPFIDTEDDPMSTFATDVDTGSYTIVRRYLNEGNLPPKDAVRVEEFVNYFKYRYAAPQKDDFAIYAEGTPWTFGEGRKNSYLLRIGLKGKKIIEANRKPAILTFVIDVSGSMNREHRLGLVKMSLEALMDRLRPEDKIGIATYNTRGRKVMSHKSLDERREILEVIDSLHASGSTNAAEGIKIGYDMAERAYRRGYINRVILCSDGVANEGLTSAEKIFETIERQVDKGITLSAIGFGMGNYNDMLLEQLGDKGNGYYAYIDYLDEALRLFDDNLTGALEVIARDVKVQVDFNPDVVRSYRLIGYENRDVPDDKFRDDTYDGGEVGAGHTVTALYELKLWPDNKGTVATTYVRYKDANTMDVREFKSDIDSDDFETAFENGNTDFRLAAATAEFAEILRNSYWARGADLADTLEKAKAVQKERQEDKDISELVELISKANRLMETRSAEYEETEEESSEEESEDIIYLEK